MTDAELELIREAANLLLGLSLSERTEGLPARATAAVLAEKLRSCWLARQPADDPDPRDGVALSERVGRWPV